MVETVEVADEDVPESDCDLVPDAGGATCVVPRPAVAGWAAVLSPPATNSSLSSVIATAPDSGSGRWPTTAAVCLAGSMAWMASTGAPA